ncbi:MAG: DUF3368 domain-containing protein [Bacteroidia bacterium]
MVVVSDTSPVSNLLLIGKLNLLPQLFGKIVMPENVLAELSKLEDFGQDISDIKKAKWINIRPANNQAAVVELSKHLDRGESEAIVIAQELNADFLLIDERRGHKVANSLNIKTLGILGVLIRAKSEGLVSEIAPLLLDLETIAGFWMGEALKKEVLTLAGE